MRSPASADRTCGAVVELADVGLGVADSGIVGCDAVVGGLHAFEAEERVLAVVLDQERSGGGGGGQVGPVGDGGQARWDEHPGVLLEVVVEQAGVGGHHAYDDAGGDVVGGGLEEGGATAAAAQADSTDFGP